MSPLLERWKTRWIWSKFFFSFVMCWQWMSLWSASKGNHTSNSFSFFPFIHKFISWFFLFSSYFNNQQGVKTWCNGGEREREREREDATIKENPWLLLVLIVWKRMLCWFRYNATTTGGEGINWRGGVCLILDWMEIWWQRGLWVKECRRGGKLKALDQRWKLIEEARL